MAGLITARQYLDNMNSRRQQYAENYGVDWWTKKKYDLDQSSKEINDYFNSGNTTAEDTARFREQAQGYYDSLGKDMDSYGSGSNRYKELKSYRDYYQNVLGGLRQDELQRSTKGFEDYYQSGKYTVDGNAKYRSEAEQAIKDLDEEMKGYNKDSEYYKMLDSYRNFYDQSIKTFDRTDAAASLNDYITADAWHSEEDLAVQKQLAQDNIDMLTQELEAMEDKESDDYKILEGYKSWYEELSKNLDERQKFDASFKGAEDYATWQKRTDYKYAAQLNSTLKQKQAELEKNFPDIAQMDSKQLEKAIASAEAQLTFDQLYSAPNVVEEGEARLQAMRDAQQLVAERDQLKMDQDALKLHQTSAILYENYKGYNKSTDYEKIVENLKDQLSKTEEDSEDYLKIQAQIDALAGVNGDGTNADGIYDENTFLGRYIMDHFDVDAAKTELAAR